MQGSSKERKMVLTMVSLLTLTLFPIFIGVNAEPPSIISVEFSPTTYDIDSPLNVSVSFILSGETINQVSIQSCHGGMCDLPSPMMDDGTGTVFSKEYPGNYFGSNETFIYFHFFIDYGTSSFIMIPADPESHQYNVTLKRTPKALLLSAEPDRTIIFQNQTVTVKGKVTNDIGQNVSGANAVLSIIGTPDSNTSSTDDVGFLSISIPVTRQGNNTLRLTVTSGTLTVQREWMVRVVSWPLPRLHITGKLSYEGTDKPPGSKDNTLYSGTNATLDYQISNTGNGDALNVTVITYDGNVRIWSNFTIGTLGPDERFEGRLEIWSNKTGDVTYIIDARFEQMAPEGLKIAVLPLTFEISFVPRPVWTGHRPFVEMFTQTTCGPCVFMEEALERLHLSDPNRMGLLVYVFEDQVSSGAFQRNGVTSTPEVIIDGGQERIRGVPTGEDVHALMDLINGSIDNAWSREVPPLVIDILEDATNTTIKVHLMADHTSNFSGFLQVYEVEVLSNLRNNIGVPIANRFMGAVGGLEISEMPPGSDELLVVPTPKDGRSLTAVVLSLDGSAVQSADLHRPATTPIFIKEGTLLLRMGAPGSVKVPFDVDSFPVDDRSLSDVVFSSEVENIPEGLSIGPTPDGPWTRGQLSMTFKYSEAERSVLSVGRTRYSSNMSFYVKAERPKGPEDIGLKELSLKFITPGRVFGTTILIDIKEDGGSDIGLPEIKDYYLKGEDRSIFFYVKAVNMTVDSIVKGRVVPCTYGDSPKCGVPKVLMLVHFQGELYRAPIQGEELKEFTHLTYDAWIEQNGVKVNWTVPRSVEIGSLMDIKQDDDEDGEGIPIFVIVASALALIILPLMVLSFLFLVKRSSMDMSVHQTDLGPVVEEGTGTVGPLPNAPVGTSEDVSPDGPVLTPVPPEAPSSGPSSLDADALDGTSDPVPVEGIGRIEADGDAGGKEGPTAKGAVNEQG